MSQASERKLFFLFKQAIDDERAAQQVYREAIEHCDNDVMRTVLQRLHDDEVRHEEILTTYYNELRTKYDVDGSPTQPAE